jgi:hypothetical protein
VLALVELPSRQDDELAVCGAIAETIRWHNQPFCRFTA